MMFRLTFIYPKHVRPGTFDSGGREAREQAEVELRRVQAETSYYARLGFDLRRLRERNHFAENIRSTIRT